MRICARVTRLSPSHSRPMFCLARYRSSLRRTTARRSAKRRSDTSCLTEDLMERSKGYAMMFLLGAFVAGGALGFTADRVMDTKHGRETRGPHPYRQRMADELKLSPQQQASIDSLIEQKHRQILALYKPVKPQLDSIAVQAQVVSDSTHAQIKKLLNPEQQQKIDRMRAGARRELAERRGGDSANRPPGPPPGSQPY